MVEKTNFRRFLDQEIRREGYLKFSPLGGGQLNQYVFSASAGVVKLAELTRPNGDRKILGFGVSFIKAFNTTTGVWDLLSTPAYSAQGKRWQTDTINGYLLANNAVDLPISYRVEDTTVTPIYEMRERGISAVGRIAEYNSFLMAADITEIRDILLQAFMRGWSTYTVGGTQAKAASFTIANADTTNQFNVTTGGTNRVATLPAVPNSGVYFWVKKVDAGVGTVTTSPVIEDITVSLTAINDLALIWWDDVEGKWAAVFFSGGVVPADAPYGVPPSNITENQPWTVINSEYGEPTNWAPSFDVLMSAASATIVLPFPSTAFIAGETRVAVINGGPLNGTLGGQEDTPNGVLVSAVSGRTLTLEQSTDPAITYPRVVTVTRWRDVSTLVGRYELQGDNSRITGLTKLRDMLVVSRQSGFYLGRYTGDPNTPFVFTPKYSGSNVPLWGDGIANINGDYLLYPSRGHRMYKFDGVTWPDIHEETDGSASQFFGNVGEEDHIYCVDNPITKEWFWCFPTFTMCYDYDKNTLSKMDKGLVAAAAVHKPLTTDEWFILSVGTGRNIYTYGLAYGVTPIATWLRDGVVTGGVMKFGLGAFGDNQNEKLVSNYTPIFSSQSPDAAIEVQLYSAWNPNATPVALLSPAESLPTPKGRNFVPLVFQALYLQDQITLVTLLDIDCRFSMRLFELELVKAAGITRSIV